MRAPLIKANPDDATLLSEALLSNPPSTTSWEQLAMLSQLSHSEVSDIVWNTCNTLKQRGLVLHGDTAPCFMESKLHCLDWPLVYALESTFNCHPLTASSSADSFRFDVATESSAGENKAVFERHPQGVGGGWHVCWLGAEPARKRAC